MQFRPLQDLERVNLGHALPLFWGFCIIRRVRVFLPRPHIIEHGVHDDHRDTKQGTSKRESSKQDKALAHFLLKIFTLKPWSKSSGPIFFHAKLQTNV